MIDLSRPPIRPGPRFPGWVVFAVLWAASFAVLVLSYSLLVQPPATVQGAPTAGEEGFLLLLGIVGLISALSFSYAGMRLRAGGSVWSNALLARGHPVGDPDTGRRQSDPEERDAWKRFRRGAITRIDYERLMARHRFAHGELSSEEYQAILRELNSVTGGGHPRS